MADALRTVILRLGKDWQSTLLRYNQMAEWQGENSRMVDKNRLQLPQLREHYLHWRALCGLGPQRDIAIIPEINDRHFPASPALAWEVLAHNMRSGHNVGALLRTSDCLGISCVNLSGYSPGPEHPTVRSTAMNCETWVPCRRWEDPLQCIAHANLRGLQTVALELCPDSIALEEFAWSPNGGLLVLGNEELGVPPEMLKACKARVYIPMYGRKASMNVASCYAITAHWLRVIHSRFSSK